MQKELLNHLRHLTPPSRSFIDQMADILGLSLDSAYRRVRGETALSLEEAVKLARHYGVSLDALAGNETAQVSFHYPSLNTYAEFKQYFESLLTRLQALCAARGKISYVADDVPLFYHFQYREHTAFKMYYWLNLLVKDWQGRGKKFTASLIPDDLLDIAQQLYALHAQVPSVEIWTDESANSTVKQLAYYWEAGLYEHSQEYALVVQQFAQILDNIQHQAEQCAKILHDSPRANYELYYSEIQVGNNCILAEIGEARLVYIRHQTFNTLVTQSPSFVADTADYLQGLQRKSVLISGNSEKQRHQFFARLKKGLRELQDRIGN